MTHADATSVRGAGIRWVLAGVALAGACVSGVLLTQHDGGWSSNGTGTSLLLGLCESVPGGDGGCAAVTGSRLGSFDFVLAGRRWLVPTSFMGLAYFLSLAIWLICVPQAEYVRHRVRYAVMAWVLGGMAVSAVLMVVMVAMLRTWCPLCGVVHLLQFVLFAGLLWMFWIVRRHACPVVAGPGLYRATVAAMLAASVGAYAYFDAISEARRQWRKAAGYADAIHTLQRDPELMMQAYLSQPAVPGMGDASAAVPRAVQVTMFTSFEQGGCACFEKRWLHSIEDALGGSVDLDVRPISPAMADVLSSGTSTASVPTALLADAAVHLTGGIDACRRVREMLYESRHAASEPSVAALAAAAGMDAAVLTRLMDDAEAWRRVERSHVLARDLGIGEVPAVFVNGRRVPDICMDSAAFWRVLGDRLRSGIDDAGWTMEGAKRHDG